MSEIEEKLRSFFKGKDLVKLAYLSGSAARGEVGELSDVDVAVYLDPAMRSKERFDLRLELMAEVGSVLGTDRVDLIIMNDVPLLLKYNVIKEGKPLKSVGDVRTKVESNILSRYLDMKYYIDRHVQNGIERVAREGIL